MNQKRLLAWMGLGVLLIMGGYAGYALTRNMPWLLVALAGLAVALGAAAFANRKGKAL